MTQSESVDQSLYRNPYGEPLFLSQSNHPSTLLVNSLFNGKDFINWNRGVLLALGSKNKEGFINGAITEPELTSDKYTVWKRCDYMIRCWILSSMTPEVKSGFLFAKSAKQLWNDIQERYGQSNAPLLLQLKKELRNLGQDSTSVVEYYNQLKRRWDEIEEIKGIPECTCGECTCNILKKIVDSASREKVLMFLMGLNDTFDNLKTNILSMDPLPTVNKVYSFVQQVESQKSISISNQPAQDVSALAISRPGSNKGKWNVWRRDGKKPKYEERWCPHCKKKGHTIDSCWDLNEDQRISYLARNGGSSGQVGGQSKYKKQRPYNNHISAYNAEVHEDMPFDLDQNKIDKDLVNAVCDQVLNAMQARLNGSVDYSTAAINFAGKILASNVVKSPKLSNTDIEWILDSGASDHMSSQSHLFTNIRKLDAPVLVGLPDGSTKFVHYVGTVKINPKITLFEVLYIMTEVVKW
ncbi:uncharacterized protein LOC141641856 [Silene latifolia]|uniref:uncharacterized protein LOC141641856 n=1 Tax=Silene latifolia TaxID=37657 RepID=UPI003D773C96